MSEIIYTSKNSHTFKVHSLANRYKSDYQRLIAVGKAIADAGYDVELLPEIHIKEIALRNEILLGAKFGKNPDFRINNEYWEEEHTSGLKERAIRERIRNGLLQADNIILNIDFYNNQIVNTITQFAKNKAKTIWIFYREEIKPLEMGNPS